MSAIAPRIGLGIARIATGCLLLAARAPVGADAPADRGGCGGFLRRGDDAGARWQFGDGIGFVEFTARTGTAGATLAS